MLTVEPHEGYLHAGLTGIARCHARTKRWGEGHWGAAALAACFFVEDNELDQDCNREVHRQLDLFVSRNRDQFEPAFAPSPLTRDPAAPVVAALERTIDRLCWVGHNVIYAALGLKALSRVSVSMEQVSGIVELLDSFTRSIPGRSWIGWTVQEVRTAEIDDSAFPRLAKPAEVSKFVLEELSAFKSIRDAEAHHDLIGHMLDFSQAINLLHDLGYEHLFQRALAPLRTFVTVLRSSQGLRDDVSYSVTSPVDRLPLREAVPVKDLPLTATYWRSDFSRHGWDGGHTFKFPYAYYDHVRRVTADLQTRSIPNFRKVLGGSGRLVSSDGMSSRRVPF